MKREEKGKGVSDAAFQEMLTRARARGQPDSDAAPTESQRPPEGKIFDQSLKRATVKLEQNLGCELPVCVSSRRETKREFIEVVTDEGVIWRLERIASSRLPAPDHYPYWLWFLDRCQAAAEHGHADPPRIIVNPTRIFDLFGAPQTAKRSGYDGWRYDALDSAFERFSSLVIRKRGGFHGSQRTYSERANLGTLCYYSSWRAELNGKPQSRSLSRAHVQPGFLLWESIKAGYLKSVPLEPMKHLTYVEQRLFTYLAKHCRLGAEFAVAPQKLLPKIPMLCGTNLIKTKLGPHHEALAKVGFLHDARVEGRGKYKLLVYKRTTKKFYPPPSAPMRGG